MTLLDVKFWNRRWIAQAIIGIWNGTNNTFGCKFKRWALDSQTQYVFEVIASKSNYRLCDGRWGQRKLLLMILKTGAGQRGYRWTLDGASYHCYWEQYQ